MSSPTLTNTDTGLNGAWVVQSAPTVTLTDAQIKALPTTPITLLAAPASGTRIRCFGATLIGQFAAGAYTNINTTYAALAVSNAAAVLWFLTPAANDATVNGASRASDFLGSAAHHVLDLSPSVDSPNTGASSAIAYVMPEIMDVSALDAQAITLTMDNNGSGVLTGGNAANSLKVILYYSVETL